MVRFLPIPAIDLKDGHCVRLRQGRMEDATIFHEDPAAMAELWRQAGARRLHVVDLNGAFAGESRNAAAVEKIMTVVGDVPVQIGGGIRDRQTARFYLDLGVAQIIIGTQAVKDPDFVEALCADYPGRIMVGIDAKNGRVATEGWADVAAIEAVDLAQRFENAGVHALIYTDIERDGMLQGLNLQQTAALARQVSIPVIASGGIASLEELRALIACGNIAGVIIGRALYEQRFSLQEAYAIVDGKI